MNDCCVSKWPVGSGCSTAAADIRIQLSSLSEEKGIQMTKYRLAMNWLRLTGVWAGIFLFFMPIIVQGQTDPATVATTAAGTAADTDTLATLLSFAKLRNELLQDIKTLNQQIDSTQSEAEKTKLRQDLEKLEADLRKGGAGRSL
ncbi:MAG: hypothetical protein ABF297_15615, partial [Thiogranum sp.]